LKALDLRPALRGNIERALAPLSTKRALDDEAVHAVRQALKRGRATRR
jgi:hypothetical protein